jgi:hypothetical protein
VSNTPPKGPQPGMSQDEKDQAGTELREWLELQEARATAHEREADWCADELLESLDEAALAREAERRGVEQGGRNRKALITALRRARTPRE